MWFYLYNDNGHDKLAVAESIHREMFALIASTGNRDAAAFSRFDQESGGVHYYFSPAAEMVAKSLGAKACEKPSKQDIDSLLYGDPAVVQRLID
ncbi:MAG: hypothetical protein ACYC0P_09495 [Thiobacillus sp.]